MQSYYEDQHIAELRRQFRTIDHRTDELLIAFARQQLKDVQATEYWRHGFSRRLGTLRHCIQGVFRVIPPEMADVPPKEVLYDAQVYLQAFVANVYGCMDNLAWVWNFEKALGLGRGDVGLRSKHKKLRASFSAEFQTYIAGMDKWFEYITEYRDALGHRIPLYIPPGVVPKKSRPKYDELDVKIVTAMNRLDVEEADRLSDEQSKLLVFQPLIIHSYKEATGLPRFHAQLLADFATVEEIAYKVLKELNGASREA